MKVFSRRNKEQTLSVPLRTRYARDFSKNWQLYLMELLPLLYVFIFLYIPMYGVQIAFRDYTAAGGMWGSRFVGLRWFEKFFRSPWFGRYLINTLRISVYGIIIGWPIPIALALCFNTVRNKLFKNAIQFISYLPYFISTVVLVGMLNVLLNSRTGILGRLLFSLSGGSLSNVLSMPEAFSHIYVWSGIWQTMGWSTIIYMAALTSVSGDQTEAAIIDGATRFQRVIHVDIPAIVPTMVIQFIMSLGSVLNVAVEKVLLMQNDLNLQTSEIISTYSFKIGLLIGSGNFSFGAAIGLFNSVVNLIILILVNYISKRVSETSWW